MADPSALDVSFDVTASWSSGFKGEITITNESAETVSGWTLSLGTTAFDIRKIWGAVAEVDGETLIRSASQGGEGWAHDLAPGESVTIGFVADGSAPADPGVAVVGATGTSTEAAPPEVAAPAAPTAPPAAGAKTANDAPDTVLAVDFERHGASVEYTAALQERDFDVAYTVNHRMDGNAFIDGSEARSGDRSLRIDYAADAHSGMGIAVDLPEAREYVMSYYVKFEDGFDFNGAGGRDGGKLPGLAGAGGFRTGGEAATGDNGFSARYMWREDGEAELYLYHMDQRGEYGDRIAFENRDGGKVFFEPGEWHHLVQRVRINDGGRSDGEIDVWMDGEQVIALDGLRFVTNGAGIDAAALDSFHGGSGADWWPDRDQSAYFDDFVFTTNADHFDFM